MVIVWRRICWNITILKIVQNEWRMAALTKVNILYLGRTMQINLLIYFNDFEWVFIFQMKEMEIDRDREREEESESERHFHLCALTNRVGNASLFSLNQNALLRLPLNNYQCWSFTVSSFVFTLFVLLHTVNGTNTLTHTHTPTHKRALDFSIDFISALS